MHSFKLVAFALTAAVPVTLAQDLEDPILSCADVSCPYKGYSPTCTVVNNTFFGIGLVSIPGLSDTLSNVSLVKGVGHSQSTDDARDFADVSPLNPFGGTATYDSAYYVGTPPSLDLSTLSGCLIVFHDTSGGLAFSPRNKWGGIETDTGTCADVISEHCIDELQSTAMKAMEHTESCQALDEVLRNTTMKSCAHFAGVGRGLGRYTVVDASKLAPITKGDNSTSDCWPVLQKKAHMSHIINEQVTVSRSSSAILKPTALLTG